MDLISLAVPFFLLLIVIELAVDRLRGRGFFNLQDALGSLSAGALNSTTGIFSKLLAIAIYAFVLEHFALFRMPAAWFDASPAGIAAWLGVLLFWDFMYYWKHRIGHEVSLFWAAHAVHHQSEEYNLTTALRQTSSDFLVGWVIYLPMFLLGVPLHVFATVSAIDLIYQFWVHTRHIDKLGWLDRVFVTPSNHRVHHAQNAAYIDRNYGGILIVWDRLFGTFAEERDDDPVVFGVRKPLASFNPWVANLQVYRYLWFDARRTRRWRDKIAIWFRRTGWRPDDVRRDYPAPSRDVHDFHKFASPLNTAARVYLCAQFAVALVLTLGVAALVPVTSWQIVLMVSAALWWLLASIGMLSDRSRFALGCELARLAFVVPLALWIERSVAMQSSLLTITAAAYAAASLAALLVFPVYRELTAATSPLAVDGGSR